MFLTSNDLGIVFVVLFESDYWTVLNEIQSICSDSSSSEELRYINGKSETFGGNFSTQKRFSYFNHSDNDVEVPCGFFRHFPVSDSGEISSFLVNQILINRLNQ